MSVYNCKISVLACVVWVEAIWRGRMESEGKGSSCVEGNTCFDGDWQE